MVRNVSQICPDGEIGRRSSLRGCWPKGYAGSSPVLGTLCESGEMVDAQPSEGCVRKDVKVQIFPLALRGCGVIGSHGSLRSCCRKTWGFESLHPYYASLAEW